MQTTFSKSDKGRYFILSLCCRIAFIILAFVVGTATASRASDFQYFNKGIDYWNEARPATPPMVTPNSKPTTQDRSPQDSRERFDWSKFLDPKNKEFFKEGDYTPPEPFMELVRSPNDYNIKMWFAYVERKNELSSQLHKKMADYLARNPSLDPEAKQTIQTRMNVLPKSNDDYSRYRFRMYFDSHCPHCKRMFATLQELQNQGYFVEARQVDNDPRGLKDLPIPATKASPQEIKEKGIQSVPLLLVGDLKRKIMFKISGFQTVDSIFETISKEGAQ